MRSGMTKKITALLVSMMMLVPMAAQAEGESDYGEFEISDLVVNYAGTEFDFSGLSLKLVGGLDAANKNAIAGMLINTPASENSTGIAVELGETSATAMILNQLVEIPYENFEEVMTKLTGSDVGNMGDVSGTMAEMWEAIAAAGENSSEIMANPMEAFDEELVAYIQETYAQQIIEIVGDVQPEDAEFEVSGETYSGQKLAYSMTSEQGSQLMQTVSGIYTDEKVMSVFEPMFSALDTQLNAAGESVNMTDMYKDIFSSIGLITFPDGITINVYTAQADEENTIQKIDIENCTMDMSAYIAAALAAAEESGAEVTGSDEAFTSMGFNANFVTMGKMDDNGTIEEPSYIDAYISYYIPETEGNFMELYLVGADAEGEGSFSMGMSMDPSVVDPTVTDEPVAISFDADWNEENGAENSKGTLSVTQGETEAANINYALTNEATETGMKGNLNVNMVSEGETVPFLNVDYTCDHAGETHNVTFAVDLMGMYGVSGKAAYYGAAMDADKLMSTSGAPVLNLATATEEEIATLTTAMQTELQNVLMGAMQVPGVANVMNMMAATAAPDAQAEVTTTEEVPAADSAVTAG